MLSLGGSNLYHSALSAVCVNKFGMSIRRCIILLAVSFTVFFVTAWWVKTPGYMDAEYYYATARQLARGDGFSEPFLWNYLDNPEGLPHPSHTYWMPLTSILSAGAILLFGESFRSAQIPHLILAVFLPLLTATLAFRLHGDRRWAWFSGIFAIFSGFYLPYLITTDTFTLYAWLGGGALWLTAEASRRPSMLRWLLLGVLIGLAHLTRADGLLFFLPALLGVAWSDRGKLQSGGAVLCGYLLFMGIWLARNFSVTGGLVPPGAGRSLWLLSYDELFSYPASLLNPLRWWRSGFEAILMARIQAMWINLQRLIAENGLIFLGPFIALGAHQLWNRRLVRLSVLYLIILFIFMSFVFPFSGANGGFFHSGAALMPILWALTPVGIDRAIRWGVKIRNWRPASAMTVFRVSSMVFVMLLTVGLTWRKAVGSVPSEPQWQSSWRNYVRVGERLHQLDLSPRLVAVNDPPGFYLATGINAVVIPNGSAETLRLVVEKYRVGWVVLDSNRPEGLASLFEGKIEPDWLTSPTRFEVSSGDAFLLMRVEPLREKP